MNEQLIGAIARGWCHPKNSSKVMDPDLVFAIADEIAAIQVFVTEGNLAPEGSLVPAVECQLCGSDKSFSGSCGGGKDNPLALCYRPAQQAAEGGLDIGEWIEGIGWIGGKK